MDKSHSSSLADLQRDASIIIEKYACPSNHVNTNFVCNEECWNSQLRFEAIRKGLCYIYQLSRKEKDFNSFGNDIIQCYYDISRVSPEPIRNLSLRYLESIKEKWNGIVQTGYWKEKEYPNPQEVLDACILLYSLQCLDLPISYRGEIQRYITSRSVIMRSQEKFTKVTVIDLFGWNPLEEEVPTSVVDLCPSCHCRSPRRSSICKTCGSPVAAISTYRVLSNSLIYSYYCHMAGIQLECTYIDFLKWLPSLRPYKSSHELSWSEFVDECYLVTHVIFTVSQWGQLRLQIQQLPHEYLFLQEHFQLVLEKRDIHLAGEFSQCLRIFGVNDNCTNLVAATHFLLTEQNTDGSWDKMKPSGEEEEVANDYVAYHATMVAIQGMLPPLFTGYGCFDEETEAILKRWYDIEFLHCTAIPTPLENSESRSIGNDFRTDTRMLQMDDSIDSVFDHLDIALSNIQNKEHNTRQGK